MSDSQASAPRSPAPSAGNSGKLAYFMIRGFVIAPLVALLALGAWVLLQHRHYQQQLATTIREVRVTGEPLDGHELNQHYEVPAGETDVTPLYLRALAPLIEDPSSLRDAETLPIVGTGDANLIPPPGETWADLEAAEALLAKYSTTLKLLHEGANLRGSARYPLDATKGYTTLLPHVQELRTAARLLSLEVQVRMHRGDMAGVAESLAAQIRLGETLKHEPVVISQLVRAAVHSIGTSDVELYLAHGEADEESLRRVQEVLEEVDFSGALHTALIGERALSYQSLQNMNAADLQALSKQSTQTAPGPSLGRSVASLRPGDSAQLLATLTESIEAAKHPFPEQIRELQKVDARHTAFFTEDQQKLPWNRHVLTQLLAPAVQAAASTVAEAQARQQAAVAAVAIERYQRAHAGELPATLEALVPEFVATVPTDPFDGQPLRFQPTEEGYRVYSLGRNQQDDGGDFSSPSRLDVGVSIPPIPESQTSKAAPKGT
jgi:type II secretory pathway pseudopilin PulG